MPHLVVLRDGAKVAEYVSQYLVVLPTYFLTLSYKVAEYVGSATDELEAVVVRAVRG